MKDNIFFNIPDKIPNEIFQDIVVTENLRIERIISSGQSSPESGWYDQDENEWVLVLSGYGILEFEDGREIRLETGDFYNIASHERHKVKATSDDEKTIWLAIMYS